MTWATILPGLVAFILFVLQWLASRMVWPAAGLTAAQLSGHWLAAVVIVFTGAGMFAMDVYGLVVVGKVDREQLDKHLDQAEYWLGSKTAHVVRVFTLGFINPRRMVAVEVRKHLTEASRLLNSTLWWVSLQLGLRIAFGLAIWVTWGVVHG
jgi:hypothetical protein